MNLKKDIAKLGIVMAVAAGLCSCQQNTTVPKTNVPQNGTQVVPHAPEQTPSNTTPSTPVPSNPPVANTYPTANYQAEVPILGHAQYNPATVVNIQGTVQSVVRVSVPNQPGYIVHIVVRTPQGDIPVQLGPSLYIEQSGIGLQPMDQVTIIGSQVNINGAPNIIAAQVIKGNFILRLRNPQGEPLW